MKTFSSGAILNRLKEALQLPNDKELANTLGISKAAISNWRKRNSIDLDRVFSVCEQINIDWLLTGEGSMSNEELEPVGNAELLGIQVPAIAEATVPVRFFEPEPSATFKEFCEGMNESPETINILPEQSDHIDELSCVFKVSGDSMAPQIQNGAKVLCREVIPSRWHYVRKGVIAIVYDDRFVIKRVEKNCLDHIGDNYILLSSDNPEYPGKEKAYLGNIRCIFEVIRVISQRVY